VPKHSARVVVEQVDIVSGVGRARAEAAGPAATRFHDVHRLVTDLGVFDFGGPGHTLRFVSVHPGVTVEDVREASGCEIHADGDVPQTRTPTDAELTLIRELLDPSSLREREVPAR
jgi:acyl CoA:acetate/3-ketoacid CoA transferase beta subunit